jgi:hypothetical protein
MTEDPGRDDEREAVERMGSECDLAPGPATETAMR